MRIEAAPLVSANEPVINRRTAIGAVGAAAVGLSLAPGRAMAHEKSASNNAFVLLLKGPYSPVVTGPDLGLSTVNLNDGSYSTTKIFAASGLRGHKNTKKPIGDFYVQFDVMNEALCAYRIPGGTFSMRFIVGGDNFVLRPDGKGGNFLEGTFELTVLEGTRKFRSLAGGHNHMVDKLHLLADQSADEFCFCFVSPPFSESMFSTHSGEGGDHRRR
jgi:hypothetical protein